MSEQQIQTKIKTWLESQGAYVIKVISATKAGIPDLIVCYKGLFIGIEVKRPSTKSNVSKLQKYNLDKIIACGGHSMVAWDLDMVKNFIGELDETL